MEILKKSKVIMWITTLVFLFVNLVDFNSPKAEMFTSDSLSYVDWNSINPIGVYENKLNTVKALQKDGMLYIYI